MRYSISLMVLAASSMLALAACGSDDDTAGIDSEEAWCATMVELDGLMDSENSTDDFAAEQAVYKQANDEVQLLITDIDVVDESVRSDIRATLEWVGGITAALSDAPDETAADAALAPFFESFPGDDDSLGGAPWILDTCGVDIND